MHRKSIDNHVKGSVAIENAFIVILNNAYSIKAGTGSRYSPDGSLVIEKAKEVAKDFPHLYEFLELWGQNKLDVVVK